MNSQKNVFYVVINGMDLTGKTTLADTIKENCREKNVQVLRSSFSKNNPLNLLASKLRKERETGEFNPETLKELFEFARNEDPILFELLKNQAPVISDEAIGHLYADATAKELELYKPTTSIIHDSSTIIKTLTIHKDLKSSSGLLKKLENLRLNHPKPTKPEYSILLEASVDAKIDRLNKRIKASGYVSEIDKQVLSNPEKIQRQAEIMKEITIHTFPGTMVFDSTKMSEKEVFDAVRNHLDICKGRDL